MWFKNYPTIKCVDAGQTNAGQNIEAFEELKRSFQAGGNTLACMGIHNSTSYNIRSGNTDTTGTFMI